MTMELAVARSTLRHVEVPEGYRAEVVHGEIILSPTRAFHLKTIIELSMQIVPQLPPHMDVTGDTITPFPREDSELCPDLIVLPRAEVERNDAVYEASVIEIAFEVVSPTSRARDYELKPRAYAGACIPVYVIADPYRGQLVVHSHPRETEYGNRRAHAYGEVVRVPGAVPLTVDTTPLPVHKG